MLAVVPRADARGSGVSEGTVRSMRGDRRRSLGAAVGAAVVSAAGGAVLTDTLSEVVATTLVVVSGWTATVRGLPALNRSYTRPMPIPSRRTAAAATGTYQPRRRAGCRSP